MTKILIATHEFPPYPGGVGRYTWSVAAAAANLGHDVTVLAPSYADNTELASAPDVSATQTNVEIRRFAGSLFHFRAFRELRSVLDGAIDAGNFDVVHATDWPMILALGKARRARFKRVASFHGTDAHIFHSSIRARFAGARRIVTRFDRIAFISKFTQGFSWDLFPRLRTCAQRVVYPGVDDYWFEPPTLAEQDDFRRQVGYAPGEKLVLTVARLDSRKGHLQTIAALARLPETRRAQFRYVAVGATIEPEYRRQLEHAAATSRVKLVLTGRLPDNMVRAAYSCSDVFALTALELTRKVEGFGLVILEAAAQGLGCVVTRVNALPEVIAASNCGIVCPPNEPDETARAIEAMVTTHADPVHRNDCVRSARSFSWASCARDMYADL